MAIPSDGGGFRRDGDATDGAIVKTNMDQAKSAMDKALKKFKDSFFAAPGVGGSGNMADTTVIKHAMNAQDYDSKRNVRYTFRADTTGLKSAWGVAYGHSDEKFDGYGWFGYVTYSGSGPKFLTRKNSNGAVGYISGASVRLGLQTDAFYKNYIDYVKKKEAYKTAKGKYDAWIKKYGKTSTPPQDSTTGGGGGGGTAAAPAAPSTYAYGDTTLKYNLGAVNEMYFSPASTAGGTHVGGGNQPVRRVGNAQELWTDKHYVSKTTGTGKKKKTTSELVDNGSKSAYKGMVQSYTRTAAQTTTGGSQETTPNKSLNPFRMGFQFHYNPSRISTTWAGNVNVDVGFVASGKDKFGPIGAALATGSGLTITIPLNRLSDMKYVNAPESEWDTMPWQELYGVPLKEAPSGKESKDPTFEDLRKIRDLGTMYDVEFLLQTIVGYRMKSAIRLNRHALTSDLGYLGGLPVELHLGKNLRYYVSVTNISVNHSIFTKDMVPTLSELTFTCSRLPDYITK